MVGWRHWLNRHESEQTPGDSEGQGRLADCSPSGRKQSDTTEWLNDNDKGQTWSLFTDACSVTWMMVGCADGLASLEVMWTTVSLTAVGQGEAQRAACSHLCMCQRPLFRSGDKRLCYNCRIFPRPSLNLPFLWERGSETSHHHLFIKFPLHLKAQSFFSPCHSPLQRAGDL